jgi:hypothetical protein
MRSPIQSDPHVHCSPRRRSGSQETLRWRKPDSNRWSHLRSRGPRLPSPRAPLPRADSLPLFQTEISEAPSTTSLGMRGGSGVASRPARSTAATCARDLTPSRWGTGASTSRDAGRSRRTATEIAGLAEAGVIGARKKSSVLLSDGCALKTISAR